MAPPESAIVAALLVEFAAALRFYRVPSAHKADRQRKPGPDKVVDV
jgi:hypothetical protein